jgi:hypothetical protein
LFEFLPSAVTVVANLPTIVKKLPARIVLQLLQVSPNLACGLLHRVGFELGMILQETTSLTQPKANRITLKQMIKRTHTLNNTIPPSESQSLSKFNKQFPTQEEVPLLGRLP